MPLFVCDRCSTVENTACGDHVGNLLDKSVPKLCSACMESVPPYREGGKWHGHFERRVATAELKAALAATGTARFGEFPPGFSFAALPPWDGGPASQDEDVVSVQGASDR
jgi:hypothetical protein